jgi:hypothetical protein
MRLQKQATSVCRRWLTLLLVGHDGYRSDVVVVVVVHIVDVALIPLERQPPEKEGNCVVQ